MSGERGATGANTVPSGATQVRVYVNGRGVDAPVAGTVLDALRAFDAADADAALAGALRVTDSRGLPAALDAALHGGAIFRLVTARAERDAGDAAEFHS